MAASVRTWLVVTALLLLVAMSSADTQQVAAPPPAPSTGSATPGKKCSSGTGKPCRVQGGTVYDPGNQEEEGMFNVRVKTPTGAAEAEPANDDADYADPDETLDYGNNDKLVVVGH